MKKIIIIICMSFISFGAIAQNAPREKVKALKAAHITKQLDLSSTEAQQFWPIYNSYEKTMEGLKKEGRQLTRSLRGNNNSPDGISDEQAESFLNNYLLAEEKKLKSRKKLISDLKQVISNKKILKLIKAEADFNKRLVEQLRKRRQRN